MRRPWLLPLLPLYSAGIWMADRLRQPARPLRLPVISVGSLSAGGAGKTPVVKALAHLLKAHGVPCTVLSRGYGRVSQEVVQVDPAGDASRFGDEPLELARAGLDVWVGADRFVAGQAAEAAGATGVHLLDDGFQHRRLCRTLDVVLITLEDIRDHLLPAGNLREPRQALGRADVLIVRDDEAAEANGSLRGRFRDKPVWVIHRELQLLADAPARPFAFCGLARPEGFFAMLGQLPAGRLAFRDHHRYTAADAARLVHLARQTGADGLITTAKDAVKLTGSIRTQLETIGPIAVADVRVSFLDETAVWAMLRQALVS